MPSLPFLVPNRAADVLLTCARVQLLEVHVQHLRKLLDPPFDWDRLLALAARHGLLPLLAWHRQTLAAETLPARVQEWLSRYQKTLALRNLGMAGELVRLLRLFTEAQIPALPFKGPTLAQFAYGNLTMREFGDLDLLLRPRDLPRARALLHDQGYRPQYELTPAQESAYLAALGQISLEKPERAVVELHATLTPRAFAFPLDLAALWPRRRVLRLTGQPVAAPGAEDLLLILCMHGAKHLWKNLGWICDLAELLRSQPALNWEQVRREARCLRSERQLWLGLHLAERVLQAPLPADVSRAAGREPAVRSLAERVLRHLLDDVEWRASGLESAAFHWQVREQSRDGLRYCLSLLLTPTVADWQAVSLPSPLALLYYGVRPLRLLGKYVPVSRLLP